MGINYAKLNKYEIGGGSGATEWFRPKPGGGPNNDGRFPLRLVLKPGEDMPFFDTKIHYFRSVDGFASGACPTVKGEACPACEMFFTLRLIPEFKDDNTMVQLLRKVAPTTRVYANIVERGVDRVQVWSMPYSVANDMRNNLLTYLEDGVDLTDPEVGRDMVISVTKQGAVQKYESVTVRPRATELDIDGWEAQCHDLEAKAHGRIFTVDDVLGQMESVLGSEAPTFFEALEASKPTPTTTEPVADTESNATAEIGVEV
jgi:hypothetical protein